MSSGLFSCATGTDQYACGDWTVYGFKAGMCRVYLVKHERTGFLIDAGSPGQQEKILSVMKKSGIDSLGLIILTHGHFDHYGSAAALRDCTGAPIAIHRADAPFLQEGSTPLPKTKSWGRLGKMFLPLAEMVYSPESTTADILLEDNQELARFGLDASVVHTPGHTPGSICIMLQDSIAFVGDLISARPTNHVQRYYAFDWNQVRESFYRLRKLKPSIAFPGHGSPPLSGEDVQKLKPKY
ncbi:MAG: MBL fold metallo-hydrolase [Chitinivibrionales bacterium]